MTAEVLIAGFVGIAATGEDLARRTISNWIPAAALVGGIGCNVWAAGWRGLGYSLLGALAGFAVFLIFYLMGGMGGGDIKLMTGFGALLGAGRLMEAALWAAFCGGVVAAAVIGYSAIRNGFRTSGEKKADVRTIPYAPAITLGVWLSMVPKT